MPQIISFGEVLIDIIGEPEKNLKDSILFKKCFGGAPANYAIAARRLGASVALIAKISKDPFGEFLIEILKKEGVDTSFIKRTPKKTTLAFVALDGKRRPEFSFYRQNTADLDIREEDIKEDLFKKAKIFHFCSLSLTKNPSRSALFRALKLAKKYKLTVSFDPNLRKDLMRKDTIFWVKKALRYVDIFLPSKEELFLITKHGNPQKLFQNFKIEKIIITEGEKGSSLYEKNKKIFFPSFKVKVADTTGAGDAFSAGISVGILKNYQDKKLLCFANAVAALSLKKVGAISSLPFLEEVKKFLKSRVKNYQF